MFVLSSKLVKMSPKFKSISTLSLFFLSKIHKFMSLVLMEKILQSNEFPNLLTVQKLPFVSILIIEYVVLKNDYFDL